MTYDTIRETADAALMPTYGRFSVALEQGKSATVRDAEGREYIDFGSAYRQYQVALNYYNRQLKRLAALVGLETGLSSYTSRHSWATAARNHEVPLPVISAGLGHTSEHTTRIYLDCLESSVIDRANRAIVACLAGGE